MKSLFNLLQCAAAGLLLTASSAATAQSPCVNGLAAGLYPCDNIDLLSTMGINQVGGGEMNDIWGWTDPATERYGCDGEVFLIYSGTITDTIGADLIEKGP